MKGQVERKINFYAFNLCETIATSDIRQKKAKTLQHQNERNTINSAKYTSSASGTSIYTVHSMHGINGGGDTLGVVILRIASKY